MTLTSRNSLHGGLVTERYEVRGRDFQKGTDLGLRACGGGRGSCYVGGGG